MVLPPHRGVRDGEVRAKRAEGAWTAVATPLIPPALCATSPALPQAIGQKIFVIPSEVSEAPALSEVAGNEVEGPFLLRHRRTKR
jgi:hypothetical protein